MRMKCNRILWFIIILAVGVFFRVWQLCDRPMHTDEAVHADKFRALLEEGAYTYDPAEYHGPTLNYLTLLSARLRGQSSYTRINENTLRSVPAVFGIGIIFAPLFFYKEMSRKSILLSCALIAFSPAFVFYSRYYIQETLLVFSTACFLGCVWRYLRSGHFSWAIYAGFCAGLMHATKETFIFSIIAVASAIIVCLMDGVRFKPVKALHVVGALTAMGITSAVLFSSFGRNPTGIIDSGLTYFYWARRAGGSSFHIHPWYYYLDILTWTGFFGTVCWNENIIVVLGGIAAPVLFVINSRKVRKNSLFVFFVFYVMIVTLIYHVIPYKTPWCVLSFLYGMAILAGFTFEWLTGISKHRYQKVLVGLIAGVCVVLVPCFQSWMLNFTYSADEQNPYVYGHTSRDIYEMVDAVNEAVGNLDEGESVPIYVIAAGDDYWPLPWYLREYKQVGYWNEVDDSVCSAEIILANTDVEEKLLSTLYSVPAPGQKHLYVPLFDGDLYLRPAVPWRGYIRKDLLDKMARREIFRTAEKGSSERVFMDRQSEGKINNLLTFNHQAMNTDFQIFLQDAREEYAGKAAREAFLQVDRLEGLLSKYIDNSDVSRINAADPGREMVVDSDTYAGLTHAYHAWQITEGYYDVTVGSIIGVIQSGGEVNDQSLTARWNMEMLHLNPTGSTVTVTDPGVQVDLGGIGKGYAVDVIGKTLNEWGIRKALISAGASSVMAMDGPDGKTGWPVTISDPVDGSVIKRLQLNNEVLSSSGITKAGHIVNPFTGEAVTNRKACWVRLNTNAAMADAVSTAAMIMPVDKLLRLGNKVDGLWLIVLTSDGNILLKTGGWPED